MSTKSSSKDKIKDKVKSEVDKKTKKKESTSDGEDKSVKSAVKKAVKEKTEEKSIDKGKKEKSVDKSKEKTVKDTSAVDQTADLTVDNTLQMTNNPVPAQYEFYNDTLETLVYDRNAANYNKIVTVEEAYRIRSQWVAQVVQSVLYQKRESLVSQIKSLDERIEEVKNNRIFIEREVKSEYNAIIERLKNVEGNKTAHLVHEMNELQKDIDRIDWIAATTGDQLANSKVQEFLVGFQETQQSIEYAVTKPFKESIDVEATDFVNELEERNKKLREYDSLVQELAAKDEVIYKLIEENNESVGKAIEEIKASTESEIGHWMDLTEHYKGELSQSLKLRAGLKDYVDILKEKFRLDDNLTRIVERQEGQNLLKYNYDKTRTLKMDVRDVITTIINILQLTKGSAEFMDTVASDSSHVTRVIRRIKMYYEESNLKSKLEFADYEEKGRINTEVAQKMLNREFKEIAIGEEVKVIVDFYSDKEGFDYRMFAHKFYEMDKHETERDEKDEEEKMNQTSHSRYDNLLNMKKNLDEEVKPDSGVGKAKGYNYHEDRLNKKREIIRLSADDYRNNDM